LVRKFTEHLPVAGEKKNGDTSAIFASANGPNWPAFRRPNEPSLAVFVQGRKRINMGGITYLCDEVEHSLLTSVDVPVVSQNFRHAKSRHFSVYGWGWKCRW